MGNEGSKERKEQRIKQVLVKSGGPQSKS